MTTDTAPERSFAAYLTRDERDQLDARAATAEQERDDALDDLRDVLHDLQIAVGTDYTTASSAAIEAGRQIATLRRERDEALEARDVLRAQLDTARADTHHDIARQLDILAADPGILRDWLTTCQPQPVSFGELFHALAEKLRRDDRALARYDTRQEQAAGLGSPAARAQDQEG